MTIAEFCVPVAAMLSALPFVAFAPEISERAWTAVANVVTFGWYQWLEGRAARLAPAFCTHWQAVAVYESVTEDIVAWLCPDCDRQLATRPPLALPPLPPFVPDPLLTGRCGT